MCREVSSLIYLVVLFWKCTPLIAICFMRESVVHIYVRVAWMNFWERGKKRNANDQFFEQTNFKIMYLASVERDSVVWSLFHSVSSYLFPHLCAIFWLMFQVFFNIDFSFHFRSSSQGSCQEFLTLGWLYSRCRAAPPSMHMQSCAFWSIKICKYSNHRIFVWRDSAQHFLFTRKCVFHFSPAPTKTEPSVLVARASCNNWRSRHCFCQR